MLAHCAPANTVLRPAPGYSDQPLALVGRRNVHGLPVLGHRAPRHLDALVTLMRRTELDIDETVAAIGAIYSQLQIIGAREIDSSRAKRLSTDVEEQAGRLSDLLAAMDEVYGSSRSG